MLDSNNGVQELDEAARRRMPKQLYIPLPCAAARRQMIDRQLGKHCLHRHPLFFYYQHCLCCGWPGSSFGKLNVHE